MAIRNKTNTFENLINRGISEIKPYTPGLSIEEVVREKKLSNVIKMASNENPLGMSPKAYRAVVSALKASYHYPEVTGMRLREALGKKFEIPPDYIVTGNGADELIYTAAMTFLDEGDEVIIPKITFSMYEIVSKAMRAKVIKSPMDFTALNGIKILPFESVFRLNSFKYLVGCSITRFKSSPLSVMKSMLATTPNFLPVSSLITDFPITSPALTLVSTISSPYKIIISLL